MNDSTSGQKESREICADVIIYGGTSAAITAAVQARRMGVNVAVVSPDRHLGGLSASGLGYTDAGRTEAVGGVSREFYHRVWSYYQKPETWAWQARDAYQNKGQDSVPAMDDAREVMWVTEPRIAECVFEDWVSELDIPVYRDEWLDRSQGVEKEGARIVAIRTLSGRTYRGRVFIDATYEGDLVDAAGVTCHIGREAGSVYGEEWNGVQVGILHHDHHFGDLKISPYVVPDDPSSGLVPGVSAEDPGQRGDGDHRIQAYCYRLCLTDCPENRVAFQKPEGYDPDQYELLLRVLATGWRQVFKKFDKIPNRKTDTNNHGPMSMNFMGGSQGYAEASYAQREKIVKAHETYQKGLLYFLANDERVPEDVREQMSQYGLPADEFKDTGHWPYVLYIREARRMVGEEVMTEHNILGKRDVSRSVGKGSYTLDSHNVQRYVTPEGYVQNEGDIGVWVNDPYQIGYGSIVPKKAEADNLLVPVCVSSSHIAFGSIRMEPVFMILGQSAATAAVLSIKDDCAVQDVDYQVLSKQLIADGQRL